MTGRMKKRILEAEEWTLKDVRRRYAFRAGDIREILKLASSEGVLDAGTAVIYALMLGMMTGYRMARNERKHQKNIPASGDTPTRTDKSA